MYSDFYEIPLPALRFEKVEEPHREVNDTKENKRSTTSEVQSRKTSQRMTYTAHRQQHKWTTRKQLTRFPNNKTQTEKERQ